jgi:hypothetical protein
LTFKEAESVSFEKLFRMNVEADKINREIERRMNK